MTKIAMILGADPTTVADDMQEVLDFETQLANVSLKNHAFFGIYLNFSSVLHSSIQGIVVRN